MNPPTRFFRPAWPILLLGVGTVLIADPSLRADNVVVLNHSDGSVTPFQTVELSRGDILSVVIIQTQLNCTTYSISAQESKPDSAGRSFDANTTKSLTIKHDGKSTAYLVSATKTSTSPGCTLPDRVWTLPVFTHKWALGFAGAFTIDTLTDSTYYLEASSKDGNTGYVVHENTDSENKVVLGAAAMVHVYHTKWAVTANDFGWVPLSFGLGVGTTSQTRYFVGTGFRLGDQFFLTLGGVFGSVKRLPDGLVNGGSTTDPNALSSPPTSTRAAFFAALSFAFLGTSAKSTFQAPFVSTSNSAAPKPPAAPVILGASWTAKANGEASITGSGFGTHKEKVKVTVAGGTATVTAVSDASIAIVVSAADRDKNPPLAITVSVSDVPSNTFNWPAPK